MDDWTIKEGAVLWGHYTVKGADVRSFEALSDTWAKDSRRVYCQDKPLRGADVSSFKVLNALWAVDKGMVYYTYGQIKEADPGSFRPLDDGVVRHEKRHEPIFAGFAADKHYVFHYVMTVGKPSKLPHADPETFEVIGPGFGRDSRTAYYERFRISRANPATLRHLGGLYCTDEQHVFYGNDIVVGAHVDSFVVSQERRFLARDRSSKYSRGKAE